jgi:hypothetical protein
MKIQKELVLCITFSEYTMKRRRYYVLLYVLRLQHRSSDASASYSPHDSRTIHDAFRRRCPHRWYGPTAEAQRSFDPCLFSLA